MAVTGTSMARPNLLSSLRRDELSAEPADERAKRGVSHNLNLRAARYIERRAGNHGVVDVRRVAHDLDNIVFLELLDQLVAQAHRNLSQVLLWGVCKVDMRRRDVVDHRLRVRDVPRRVHMRALVLVAEAPRMTDRQAVAISQIVEQPLQALVGVDVVVCVEVIGGDARIQHPLDLRGPLALSFIQVDRGRLVDVERLARKGTILTNKGLVTAQQRIPARKRQVHPDPQAGILPREADRMLEPRHRGHNRRRCQDASSVALDDAVADSLRVAEIIRIDNDLLHGLNPAPLSLSWLLSPG